MTIVAALAALAIGASAPALAAVPHTAAPRVLSESLWDNGGCWPGCGGPTFSLHAHAHNQLLTTCHRGCTAQAWNTTLCTQAGFPDGHTYGVCELRLIGTNPQECANWVPSGNSFFLDNCVGGDPNEEFTCCIQSGAATFMANERASNVDHQFEYFSAFSLAESSPIVAEANGDFCNGCALWYWTP
jgi:hypothetical protein